MSRGVTLIRTSSPRTLRGLLREHLCQIRVARRPQAMFLFGGALHRIDVCSQRGARWMIEHEPSLMGVYTASVTLEQLVEDTRVMLGDR